AESPVNASRWFADCANAIKGVLIRWEPLGPAHICGDDWFPQSTLVSPTRLADRASNRGSITLDALHVFINYIRTSYKTSKHGRQLESWFMTHKGVVPPIQLLYRRPNLYSPAQLDDVVRLIQRQQLCHAL